MKVNWKNEKNSLERLISEGVPYERIGRQYGVTGNAVKKAAKNLGIELEHKREINPNEHFNKGKTSGAKEHICLNCGENFIAHRASKGKFCSNRCQGEYQYKQYIERWKKGEEDGLSGTYNISRQIKRYLFEKYGNKCQKCGWGEENPHTHTTPLEIHHIDGDYTNNNENNLQLLCPNCHSLTDTYKNHNKAGRKERKRYNV